MNRPCFPWDNNNPRVWILSAQDFRRECDGNRYEDDPVINSDSCVELEVALDLLADLYNESFFLALKGKDFWHGEYYREGCYAHQANGVWILFSLLEEKVGVVGQIRDRLIEGVIEFDSKQSGAENAVALIMSKV